MMNLKSPYVMILIGAPLSGKTSWVKDNPDLGEYILISRDQIVMDVYGDDDYNKAFSSVNQKLVDSVLREKIEDAAKNKENVVLDMTHMTRKRRKHNLSFFSDDYYKIGVVFPILSDEEYNRRNQKRNLEEKKNIPSHVLKNMISSYQTISPEEGFDKIISLK